MTSTEGRCVASTRWMPTARAICASRAIGPSTSAAIVSMRSASSSTMMTRCGIPSAPSPAAPFRSFSRYPSRFRTPTAAMRRYRRSISETAHVSIRPACFASVTTGQTRWGMPS